MLIQEDHRIVKKFTIKEFKKKCLRIKKEDKQQKFGIENVEHKIIIKTKTFLVYEHIL